MKKVGLLTLPLWNNYGGILQLYALQRVLKKNGFSATFIDYQREQDSNIATIEKKLKNSVKKYFLSLFSKDKLLLTQTDEIQKYISKNTRLFVENKCKPKTSVVTTFEDLRNLNSQFEAFIVGSDQVWRAEYTPCIRRYFLDFVVGNKAVSYAASFGGEHLNYEDGDLAVCIRELEKFHLITVRENAGKKIVKEKFGKDSEVVLDPTMLLDREDYVDLISGNASSSNRKKLFCYILDKNALYQEALNKLVKLYGYHAFEVKPKQPDIMFSFDDDSYIYPDVENWLSAFNECEYVLADSFHGCVFAIIFNKPFIAIGNKKRGLSRFETLLERFGLIDRLVTDMNSFDFEKLAEYKFDWVQINKILDREKALSMEILINSLSDS